MTVIDEIAEERQRQIEVEDWSAKHDDRYDDGSLAQAAACYAHPRRIFIAETVDGLHGEPMGIYREAWPDSWIERWWKPKTRRRDLIRAGALIVAEIERLDRADTSDDDPGRPVPPHGSGP